MDNTSDRTPKERIEITSPIKTYILLVIFSFLATLLYTIAFIFVLVDNISNGTLNIFEIIFACIVFFITSQLFLWYLRGEETITVKEDKIFFIRTNGLIKIKKSFLLSDIDKISLNPLTYPSNSFLDTRRQYIREMKGAIFFWNNMGRIEFKIKNNYKTFFNGFSEKQAEEIIKQLETIVNSNKSK